MSSSSMEGKLRLLQVLAFSTGPAIDVAQHYVEVKIIHQFGDFEQYLNDPQNKHKLFHEHYPKIPCCGCIPISIAAPFKSGCLGNQQFAKLYDVNGTVTAGHEKTRGSQISQHCLCKVSAQKSVKVTDIDITLLKAIIEHCCPLHTTSKISRWMIDIKEVRNTFFHWPDEKLDKNLFDLTWKKLETATLECAGDIGHACVKIFKMAIDQITTWSVADLKESILKATDNLSEVREDLNGVNPIVRSILSNQNAVTDKISTQSKDLNEVKTGVADINTAVGAIKIDVAGVNTAVAEVDTKVGDVRHKLSDLTFVVGMILKQGEKAGVNDKAEKRRKLSIDVDASSSTWDEERTTCNLADKVQTVKHDYDNNEGFQLEKVVNKCIHLELSASSELFQSPQKLRKAIKSLIRQFVKAGELEENVPATVYINITVKNELTTEEKDVVYTVFGANDSLDGSDYDTRLQIEQKQRLLVKSPTIEPDQQIASTSAIWDDDVCSSDDEKEDMDFDDSVLKKRKKKIKISTELQEKDKALKKMKMSTATEDEPTDTESVKELQVYVIDKKKALQKLGEIPLIDMKIRERKREKKGKETPRKHKLPLSQDTFFSVITQYCVAELKRQRKERSGIMRSLTKIVTTNSIKLLTSHDKRYFEDLDFLNVNMEALSNKCQQCGSQGCDMIICACIACKRIFCEDCMIEHTKKFTNHSYEFRDNITRGLEYHGKISIDNVETNGEDLYINDIKSVKGTVVIIMSRNHNGCLRVYSVKKGDQSIWDNKLEMELDHKSQIAIIDDNTVAITVPFKSNIYIVNFKTDMIKTINCTTGITGAIAFINKNLYVACLRHIRKINLQGEEILSIDVPGIQFLHPVGQNKMYCLSNNAGKNISCLDITNNEVHTLSEFPFHQDVLTSDNCDNTYFINHKTIWKATYDGKDYKVIYSNHDLEYCFQEYKLCFDTSNNLLFVKIFDSKIKIYRIN